MKEGETTVASLTWGSYACCWQLLSSLSIAVLVLVEVLSKAAESVALEVMVVVVVLRANGHRVDDDAGVGGCLVADLVLVVIVFASLMKALCEGGLKNEAEEAKGSDEDRRRAHSG